MQIQVLALPTTLSSRQVHHSSAAAMKYYIFLGFVAVVAAFPGVIHEEPQSDAKYDYAPISESGHHHHVEHQHAKSHQSIKFEHFHPVPVYVKKEHSHLLKHPLEKGKSESNLKLIHPETEHKHGGGLVLEDDRHNTEHLAAALEHGGYEHEGQEQGGYEHQLHGGYEGYDAGEGLKGYTELAHQPEAEGHYYAEAGQGLSEAGEGYKYESY